MPGQLPIDRVRKAQRQDRESVEKDKRKVTRKEAALKRKARAHDDMEQQQKLERGETV